MWMVMVNKVSLELKMLRTATSMRIVMVMTKVLVITNFFEVTRH